MQFSDLIDKRVAVVIPAIHPTAMQEVVIRGVEVGGIWIESDTMTQSLLRGLNLPSGQTPLFFFPYSGVKYAFFGESKLALNESAFGV
jgi:hypothetical protein